MNVGNVIPCISSNMKSKWFFFYERVQNKSFDLCSSLKKVGHPFFALAIRRKAENLVANVYQSSTNIYYCTLVQGLSEVLGIKLWSFFNFRPFGQFIVLQKQNAFLVLLTRSTNQHAPKMGMWSQFLWLTFYYVDFGNWTIFYAYFVVASVNVTWQG